MAIKIFYPNLKDKLAIGDTVIFDIKDSNSQLKEKTTYSITKIITETIRDSVNETSNTTIEIEKK